MALVLSLNENVVPDFKIFRLLLLSFLLYSGKKKKKKPLRQSLIRKQGLRLKLIKMKTWVIDDDRVLSVSLMNTINFPIYVHRVTLCCRGSAENVFSGSDMESAGAC